jgi:hypothetical protein
MVSPVTWDSCASSASKIVGMTRKLEKVIADIDFIMFFIASSSSSNFDRARPYWATMRVAIQTKKGLTRYPLPRRAVSLHLQSIP